MMGLKAVNVAFMVAVVAGTPAAAASGQALPDPVQTTDGSANLGPDPEANEMRGQRGTLSWTDAIRAGSTSIKAVHFLELRRQIGALREREGLPPARWTDPVLTAGTTPVKRVHLTELHAALDEVYDAVGRPRQSYANGVAIAAGTSAIEAAHVTELREAVEVVAGPSPSLAPYFVHTRKVIDPTYPQPVFLLPAIADLDGDGHEDLVVLGGDYPTSQSSSYRSRAGRVYLGDGDGGFARAPAELFPVDTLNTVSPSCCPQFGDLNGDGRPDMFLPMGGWDAEPFPGEQNRLYLSRPGGGWRDATSGLPQLSDFSHSAAIGDIRGVGLLDIVVGNIWGGNRILPYALLNGGDGSFSLDRSILPVGDGETMNFNDGRFVTGMALTDLDGDGLPELIAAGGHGNPGSFVFWNRAGAFSEEIKTALPMPAPFVGGHIDLDAAAIDADGDGLIDLVVVGTQEDPFYDGWFVQLLINRGDRTFIDETSSRLQPHERFGGRVGEETGAPWAQWVEVLDFDGDGVSDFAVKPHPAGRQLRQNQPLIWLNDGSGQFAALNVHDFVQPGEEYLITGAVLMRTRHGYSFIRPVIYPGSGGLVVTALLASREFRSWRSMLRRMRQGGRGTSTR